MIPNRFSRARDRDGGQDVKKGGANVRTQGHRRTYACAHTCWWASMQVQTHSQTRVHSETHTAQWGICGMGFAPAGRPEHCDRAYCRRCMHTSGSHRVFGNPKVLHVHAVISWGDAARRLTNGSRRVAKARECTLAPAEPGKSLFWVLGCRSAHAQALRTLGRRVRTTVQALVQRVDEHYGHSAQGGARASPPPAQNARGSPRPRGFCVRVKAQVRAPRSPIAGTENLEY